MKLTETNLNKQQAHHATFSAYILIWRNEVPITEVALKKASTSVRTTDAEDGVGERCLTAWSCPILPQVQCTHGQFFLGLLFLEWYTLFPADTF